MSSRVKTPGHSLALKTCGIGAAGWVVGFFMYFAVGPAVGLCAAFTVLSAVFLFLFRKLLALGEGKGEEGQGNPMKKSVYGSMALFVLQIIFFVALMVVGLEAMPWASSVFFTITAIYLLCPVWVYLTASKFSV